MADADRIDTPEILACPHCAAGEPSVWDDVLFHYAHPHPERGKLKLCHEPWRERCRRCSTSIVSGEGYCAQHAAEALASVCSRVRDRTGKEPDAWQRAQVVIALRHGRGVDDILAVLAGHTGKETPWRDR